MKLPIPFLSRLVRLTAVLLLAAGAAGRLAAQACADNEFEAKKIVFRSERLPIELSGFYPYIMSGTGLPKKYATETWSGSGYIDVPFPGCFISYTNMVWSGAWTFSKTDFTDTSSKTVEYDTSVCVNGHVISNNIKAGLDGGGGVATPAATPTSENARSFSDTRSISETLSDAFTLEQALSRAETFKTVVNNAGSLQYWNNYSPATADEAAQKLAQGMISRTSPITAHAERISFSAQFCEPCLGQGRFLVTYYYKQWAVGQAEPGDYVTRTEEVEFRDPPYVLPQSGYQPYHFALKQGEQCKLVKVTARSLEQCKRRAPGDSSGAVKSVDMLFYLGRRTDGSGAGMLAVTGTSVSPVLYTPAGLQLLAGTNPEVEVIKAGNDIRQVKAPEALADVVTLTPSSYEIRFYLPSQVGALSGGVYPVTGQPFVAYLAENPDAGTATNRIRFTETRGAVQKATLYTYDSGTGTIAMSTGNGLRTEQLQTTVAGSTVTETRTIKDASSQTVSVVQETKQDFAFGRNVVQRVLDPAGAHLSTTYAYYTDSAADGGNYGQVKQVVDESGHWTRYTYDSLGRPATTVTQYLDSAVGSADSANRVTSITYGTIPDQDGDAAPEQLVTTTQSLLGQEIGRSYEVIFSQLGTAFGAGVETRWSIVCTAAGAPWNASGNLVTKRRTLANGTWLGRPVTELRPDGTLTTYDYAADASHLTTTILTGQADGTGAAVAAGTRTVLVETLVGQLVSRDAYDYPSNTLLTSETVSQTDSLGRPTRIDFLDGTHELRSYACCGLDMMTDRQGIVTSYNYNGLGQVDRETRAGIALGSTLDPNGRLLSRTRIGTDNSSITTESHHYDLAGRLTWSKDALNRQTSFSETFDGSGHKVRTTTNPDGGTVVQTYAKDGALLTVTGTAAPQKLTYEYGVATDGVFTKEIRVGSANETTEWVKTYTDFAGRAYKRLFADSATEQSYYNGLGQLVRQVDADGIATLFAYNAKGEQEVTALDLDGNGTIDYAGTDRITRTVADVASHGTYTVLRSTTQVWETDGQDTPVTVAISETTPDGLRSWQTARGLVTAMVTTLDGSGGRTVMTTAPDGTVTTQTFANDLLVANLVTTSGNSQLSAVTYAYDAHNRLQTATDARNGITSYSYFDDDQIHTVTTPDPDTSRTGAGYDPQTTTYGYDPAGRQNLVTQPDGGVVNTTFWPAGQVRRTWGSRTYPVEYTYDAQGRVKTLTTWKDFANATGAAITTWNYTPTRGFLLNKRHADNTGPSYTYKPSGRLLTRTWARGTVTTYGYSAAGELNSVDYSDSTPDVAITYDRSGRQKTRTDASGLCLWSYHASGQLQDEVYSSGLLNGLSVARGFDPLARLSSLSASLAGSVLNQIGYSYDAASRLDTVTSGTNTATYGYAPNSLLVQTVTFAQGGTTRLTTTKAYDNLNRLSAISNLLSALNAQLSTAYSYNNANQRTKLTRETNAYWNYGYDSLGQVTSAQKYLPGATLLGGFDHAWTYDDIGNRKTATSNSQTSTFSSNSLNQYLQKTVPGMVDVFGTAVADANVTVNGQAVQRQGETWYWSVPAANSNAGDWISVTAVGVRPGGGPGGADAVATSVRKAWVPQTPEVFSYDADGNLTGDGRWLYTWDGENRLVAMETRSSILPPLGQFPLTERRKLEFAYDAQGRRFSKKVSNWNGTGWTLASSRLFHYDGWNLLAELNALNSNAAVATYVWGSDLSGSLQGAGGVGGLLFENLQLPAVGTYALAYDGNGNAIAYVDMATGAKSATFEYGAFGETIVADGALNERMPFRFSTKYTDNETNLLYYGLRYYSPGMGRWLSRDPSDEDEGGAALYGFIQNDSVNGLDYLGLFKTPDHREITVASFESATAGMDFKSSSISKDEVRDIIFTANHGQDLFHLLDNHRHYNRNKREDRDNADQAYADYLTQENRGFVNDLAEHKCKKALKALGRLSHSWQDFFAHAIRRDGQGGRENSRSPGWEAWSVGVTGTPDQRGSFAPSSFSFFGGGEHPTLTEPLKKGKRNAVGGYDGREYNARKEAAKAYTTGQFNTYLGQWLSQCKCSSTQPE